MRVDLHAHLVPAAVIRRAQSDPSFPAKARSEPDATLSLSFRNGEFRRLEPTNWDVTRRLAELGRVGLDAQMVSVPPFLCLDWLAPEEAANVIPAINDELVASCRETGGRLLPMCGLPLQAPGAARAELRRCVGELGVRAFQLPANVNGGDLDQPEFEPVLGEAAATGALLFIHPLSLTGFPRLHEYYNTNLVGNPLDTHLCAARLIFGGVFDRLPELRICLAHAGGSLPWGIARLDHGYLVRPEARRVAAHPPSHYFRRLFFDTVVHSPRHLAFLHDLVGPEQILLGSDWPFDMGFPDPIAELERVALEPAARAAIAGGNARRLGLVP